jgi:hypothetical protein
MDGIDQNHPSWIQLLEDIGSRLNPSSTVLPLLLEEKISIDGDWKSEYSESKPSVIRRAISKTFDEWIKGDSTMALRTIHAAQLPGISTYLRYDTKPIARHRARLRFNLGGLNSSPVRRGAGGSIGCPDTRCVSEETVEHVLLMCPRYDYLRFRLQCSLNRYDIDLDLRVALGCVDPVDPRLQAFVLHETGCYVLKVCKRRKC